MRSSQPLRKIRVFVADSNAIHSQLLAQALGRDQLFDAVGYAANSADIQQAVLAYSPDVLLISANLHEKSAGGLELLAKLRVSVPDLKPVALLDTPKREIVVQAFRVGARGVFSKDAPIKNLAKCITCIYEGQVWATAEELGFVLEALTTSPALRPLACVGPSQLSRRESEIVSCVAQGLSNREIAERLSLSRHTVKNYMFRLFDKLGVSTRVELLFYAYSRPATENRSVPLPHRKSVPGELAPASILHQQSHIEPREVGAEPKDRRSDRRKLTPTEPDFRQDRQPGPLAGLASV